MPLTTRQADLGLRYVVSPGLSLVAGVSTISKPYFNSDAANVYRQLGASTNRGAEFSLAGTVAPGVSLIPGRTASDTQARGWGERRQLRQPGNTWQFRPIPHPAALSTGRHVLR